jgi:GAF domain-containing protein/HAMP domain-containing protein
MITPQGQAHPSLPPAADRPPPAEDTDKDMTDQMSSRRGWSLRARLTLVLLVIASVASLTTAAIGITSIRSEGEVFQRMSREALSGQAESYLVQLTQRGAREIDLTLGEIARAVENAAGFVASAYAQVSADDLWWHAEEHMTLGPDGQYLNGEEDISSVFVPITSRVTSTVLLDIERSAYLDFLVPGVLANNPSTVAVYLGTPRDVVRYYPNIQLGLVVPPDFAVTGRPWYVGAMAHSNADHPVWWTEPYLDATGRGLVTTAAMPVRGERGQLIGVIGFDITLDDLRASVEATRFLQTGYPFVIDRTGRAIALPEQGYRDLLGRDPEPGEVGADVSTSTTGFASVLVRMASGTSGFESLEVAGRDLFVAYTPLESTEWSLGSVVEASQVLAPAQALEAEVATATQTLLFSRLLPAIVGLLAAFIVLGLLFTDRFVRPIHSITDAAVRLGAGQRDVQVPVTSQDEIGLLADSFNRMASQIQDLVASLEQRVAERTQELQRQAVQLQTTGEIARLATGTTDTATLMTRAVDLIRERFEFYHASIFLMDETGTWAVVEASTGEAGRQLLARRHRLAVGSASIIGWVTQNRLPRVAHDVTQDPFHFPNPLLPETRSEAAIPILAGSLLLGVLDVQSQSAFAFQDADVRALEAIAAELASTLEGARILTETRDRLTEMQTTTQARWRDSWSHVLASGAPSVYRLGPGGGDGADAAAEAAASEQATATRGTVLAGGGHLAATPVQVRGEVLATITARKDRSGPAWSDDDVAILEAVASQAGLALESARQYAEERRRVVELEVVNRVGQAVTQLSNPDTLYRVIHNQVNQVVGNTDFLIGLYEPQDDTLTTPYHSKGGELRPEGPLPLGQGLAALVIRSHQTILLGEGLAEQAAQLGAEVEGDAPRSWLGVPMLVGEDMLGLIALSDDELAGRFTEDDAALLGTVAGQVATALQNARLLEQVRRTARRQQLIHEITSKIRRSADFETVLATAARELSRSLTASKVVAQLGRQPRPESETGSSARPPMPPPTPPPPEEPNA